MQHLSDKAAALSMTEDPQAGPAWTPRTVAVHADRSLERHAPDVAPAIHVSTNYATGNADGLSYGRAGNQTRERAEAVIGALEGGRALLYSSGVAATLAALHALRPGKVGIGGGYFLTKDVMRTYNPTMPLVDLDAADFGRGDLLWVETPSNPRCEIDDIRVRSEKAHAVGAYVLVDSTFGTPVLQRPLSLGADVVLHSATKYLGGHSDLLGGVLIVTDDDLYNRLRSQRTVLGSVPGNLESFLLLRSLRTLAMRVKRQSRTATKVAVWLSNHPAVAKVWHPSVASHPGYELCKTQMSGAPACFAMELTSADAAKDLSSKLRLFIDATSLGGCESLVDYRHRYDATVSPRLLRLSIGLESAKDLIADLDAALNAELLEK